MTGKGEQPRKAQKNFMYKLWKLKVSIIQERPELLPRCDLCGMHMPETRMLKHRHMKRCNKVM